MKGCELFMLFLSNDSILQGENFSYKCSFSSADPKILSRFTLALNLEIYKSKIL